MTCKTQVDALPVNINYNFMKNAREIANRFYNVCNSQQGKGFEDFVHKQIEFQGPVMRLSGAEQYIAAVGPLLKFHKGMQMLKQFEDGNEVCSIYEMTLGTPAGGTLTLEFADWIRVADGQIVGQKLYYDPREFMKAFGM